MDFNGTVTDRVPAGELAMLVQMDLTGMENGGLKNTYMRSNNLIERYGADSIWKVHCNNADGNTYINPIYSSRDGTPNSHWVNVNSLRKVMPQPIIGGPVKSQMIDLGIGVEKFESVHYRFENQIYSDKKQILFMLLARLPQITMSNFTEVTKRMKEIEETWNKM